MNAICTVDGKGKGKGKFHPRIGHADRPAQRGSRDIALLFS
jgi:hypothetical protein